MGLRNFRDSRGGEWRVWDVVPYGSHPTERRASDRRAAQSGAYTGPERRSRERRMRTPGLLTPGLESGWLCFESEREKRRLTPIPAGWDELSESDLERMAQGARAVGRRGTAADL